MALASAFTILARDHDLKAVTDEELDLQTPNQRVQRNRRKGLSVFARPATATPQIVDDDQAEADKKAREKQKWAAIFKRAEDEEARQQKFGRYSAGSLYFFGPEPDKDDARFPKTLRQRFIRLVHRPWFDRLVLGVTVIYCILQTALEDKICENWLFGEGGQDWQGETGVMKRFYPLATCDEGQVRLRYIFLEIFNYLITLIFTAEMMVKVTAFGFALHPHAYLRDGWTVFELIMVVAAWAQFLPGAPNLAMVRLVRIMRPLQATTRLPGMRPVAQTLLKGARPLGSVVILCFFLTVLVGLIFIELFAGGMRGRCYHDDGSLARYGEPFDATVASGLQNLGSKPILCNPGIEGFGKVFQPEQPCPPSQTCSIYTDPLCMVLVKEKATGVKPSQEELDKVPPVCEYNPNPDPTFSMDNLGQAIMTITRTLILDNWAQSMRFLQAGVSMEAPLIVFIVLVVLGSWFVTHLAIAVIQETYSWELKVDIVANKSQSLVQKKRMGVVQMLEIWIVIRMFRLQAFVHSRLVKYRTYRRLVSMIGQGDGTRRRIKVARRILRGITGHSLFDFFIMVVILTNTVTMCINYFDQRVFEDNVCGALSLAVYGSRNNCTGPLALYSRTSVLSLPHSGYYNGTSGSSGLRNTRGFCALRSNSSQVCFDSWDVAKAKNVTMSDLCASGECHGMPKSLDDFLEVLNQIFTVIFVVEMVLKIVGHGLAEYTMSWSNIFDAFIAITSIVEMTATSDKSGIGALRSFRALRVTRLFRKFPALKALLAVVVRATPRAVPLVFIIILFLFVASQVGTQLMGGLLHKAVCEGVGGMGGGAGCIDQIPRTNFDSLFPTSQGYGGMVTVLAMITGQRWSAVVSVAETAGLGAEVLIFSVIVMVVGVYLMLSLSLTILTRTYIEVHNEIKEAAQAALNNKGTTAKLRRAVGQIAAINAMKILQNQNIPEPAATEAREEPRKSSEHFDMIAPGDGEYGRPISQRKRGFAFLSSIATAKASTFAKRFLEISKTYLEQMKALPAKIHRRLLLHWNRCINLLPWTRIEKAKMWLKPHQQKVNDMTNSNYFVTFITVCIIVSTIVLLSDDPLGPMTECCPTSYQMVTNSTLYFGNRFCVRGDDVANTCEGHGTCSPLGQCQCNSRPEQFTGNKCECKWFGSSSCGEGWTYMRHSDSFYLIEFLNYFFLSIFTAEMLAKWFAAGVLFPTGVMETKKVPQIPYLRDPWNVIDGFVVLISLASAFAGSSNLTGLKGLRAVRCLRPLRMLRRFPGLRAVVNCLLCCIPHVARVFGVLLVVLGIFAILGLQLFSGKFHGCMDPSVYPLSPIESQIFYPVNEVIVPDLFACLDYGGVWEPPRGNFDNFFEAFVSMLTLATRDGWLIVMDRAVDSTAVGFSPLFMSQPALAIFFLVYILIVYCFLMHCLIAAVLQEYVKLQESTGGGFISPKQLAWLEVVRENWKPRPKIEKASAPQSSESNKGIGESKASYRSLAGMSSWLSRLIPDQFQSKPTEDKNDNTRDTQSQEKAVSFEVSQLPQGDDKSAASPPAGAPPAWARSVRNSDVEIQESKDQPEILGNYRRQKASGVEKDGKEKENDGDDALDRLKSAASDFGRRASTYGLAFWDRVKLACTPKAGSRAAIMVGRVQPYIDEFKELWSKFITWADFVWKVATIWSVILVDMSLFKIGINICIAANVFLMSLRSFPTDEILDSTVSAFDALFTVIFFVEMVLKMIAYGQRKYWSSSWDAFDGVISSVCMLAVFVEASTGLALPAMTVLRGFRVLRVLRLVRSAEVLRTILFTLLMAFPALMNVLVLMLLFFLIYASLGVPLFYNVRWAEEFTGGINSFANFQGFNSAFATLFTISTGDGWVGLMHSTFFDDPDFSCELDVNLDGIYRDETGCGNKIAGLLYFVSFFVLHNYVVLNLIVVIVVNSFSVAQHSGARSSSSNQSIDAFATAWRKLDHHLTGYIRMRQLRDLVCDWNPSGGDLRARVALLRKSSKYMVWTWVKGSSGWSRKVSFESAFYAISRSANPTSILPPSSLLSSSLRHAYRASRHHHHHSGLGNEELSKAEDINQAARVIQYAVTSWSEHVRMMTIVRLEDSMDQVEIQRNGLTRSARDGGLSSLLRAMKIWWKMHTKGKLHVGKSENWGSVVVRLTEGRNLPETERAGKVDGFATVSCGPNRHRSNVALDTYDPVWNEEFAYDVKGTADSVIVEIWDDDVVANRFIGSCSVPVSRICMEEGLEAAKWYELSGPAGESRGNVHMNIAVETFKWSLDIGIVECIGLPSSFIRDSPWEEMNPYCCVVVGHKAHTTTPRTATFSPVFRERFQFDLADIDEDVRVVVLNNKPESKEGDNFVAQAKVNAARLLHADNLSVNFVTGKRSPGSWDVSVWLPLVPEDGVHPWGRLSISCVEARGLPKMDAFGKVDPFCIVRVVRPDGPDDLRGLKTAVKLATFEPKWREDFVFDVMHADSLVVVEVYDHDWSGDKELIGVVRLDLAAMAGSPEPIDAWHEIHQADQGASSAIDGSLGQIRLMTQITRENDYNGSFGYVHLQVSAHLLSGVPTLRDLAEESSRAIGSLPDEPADLVDAHLHIAVMEAKDLPKMGGIDGVQAFCQVCVIGAHGRFEDKTRVEYSRNEIQWCDEFTVRRLERDADLSVVVCEPSETTVANEIGRLDIRIRDVLSMIELESLRASSNPGDGLPGEDKGLVDKWFDLAGGLGSIRLCLSLGPRVGGNEYADIDQFVTRGILRTILEKDAERVRQEERNKAIELAQSSHLPNLGAAIPLPFTAPPQIPEGGGLRVLGRAVTLQNPTKGLLQAGVGRTSKETPLRAFGGIQSSCQKIAQRAAP